jgi:hypothetical protein
MGGAVSLSLEAVEVARSFLGTRETGQNTGPDVDLFLGSVGLHPGQPWCAAFVHYVFMVAAARLGLRNPCPSTGAALSLWRRAEPYCQIDSNPKPGYVYVLDHGGGQGHTGIIESVDADLVPTEISGNTFADARGGREGNCVARHVGTPEVTHGGSLLGYLALDLAAQSP